MKSVIRRAAVVGAATALTATTFVGPAQAAPAQDSSTTARNYYGALAINTRTLGVGTYNDAATRAGAEKVSLLRCKSRSYGSYCKKVVWVRNGCASIAIKYDSKNRPVRYASAYGKYKASTIALAKKRAQGPTTNGTVRTRVWLCTTRYY